MCAAFVIERPRQTSLVRDVPDDFALFLGYLQPMSKTLADLDRAFSVLKSHRRSESKWPALQENPVERDESDQDDRHCHKERDRHCVPFLRSSNLLQKTAVLPGSRQQRQRAKTDES